MNNKDPHPLEVLLLVALAAGWAVATLARAVPVPLVALGLALASWRPAATATTATAPAPMVQTHRPPAPALHPLALVAAELEQLPVTALRQLAGVRSKRTRKIELIAMVAACG
jgi:hypothetical protein